MLQVAIRCFEEIPVKSKYYKGKSSTFVAAQEPAKAECSSYGVVGTFSYFFVKQGAVSIITTANYELPISFCLGEIDLSRRLSFYGQGIYPEMQA